MFSQYLVIDIKLKVKTSELAANDFFHLIIHFKRRECVVKIDYKIKFSRQKQLSAGFEKSL